MWIITVVISCIYSQTKSDKVINLVYDKKEDAIFDLIKLEELVYDMINSEDEEWVFLGEEFNNESQTIELFLNEPFKR